MAVTPPRYFAAMLDRTPSAMGADAWFDGIREAVLEVVGTDRLSLEDLTTRLVDAGWLAWLRGQDWCDQVDAVADVVLESDALITSSHGLVVAVQTIVDGRRATHRLTAEDVASGCVPVGPNLDLITLDLVPGPVPGRGSESWTLHGRDPVIDVGGPPSRSLEGPMGWLRGLAPGQVLVIGREGGALYREPPLVSDDHGRADAAAGALRAAFEETADRDEPSFALPLVVEAVIREHDLFREPTLPVSELLSRAGYEQDGELFGPEGGAWERSDERAARLAEERLLARMDLDPCCRSAVESVLRGWATFRSDPRTDVSQAVLGEHLGHGDVAEAFFFVAWSAKDSPPPVESFLNQLAHFAGAHLALAFHAERMGDVLGAEARASAALRLDGQMHAASRLRGWYALDRGDLAMARRFLSNGDAPGEVIEALDEFLAVPDGVGRNSRCPCGSGRKFKGCCMGSRALSPLARVVMAHSRMLTFAVAGFLEDRAAKTFAAAIAACPDTEHLVGSGFLSEVSLYEGGLAAEYLARRGALMPADELDLIEELVTTPLRLWEVMAADGPAVILMDVAGDGTPRLVWEPPPTERGEGDLILARVVSHGGQDHLLGGGPVVDLRERDTVLDLVEGDTSAEAWASWYGASRTDGLAPVCTEKMKK